MNRFHGVIPPVVTPLDREGNFDRASFTRLINTLIDAGVHGLFVLGSSGEVAFSDDARREEIITAAVDITDGRVPVMVGCIDTETKRVIAHAKKAQALGADAIVATAPFYALGGMREVERHFRQIRAAVDLPLFAYDIPVCVHTKLPGNMLVQLGQDGVLDGVKDSSGDDVSFRFLAAENKKAGSPLVLLTGHEVVVDGAYLSGADGVVPGLGNIDPVSFVEQYNAYRAGDWEKVRTLQDHLTELMRIVLVTQGAVGFGAGVGAFKTALALLGVFESNRMPEPVPTLVDSNVEAIAQQLAACGFAPTRTAAEVSCGEYAH